MNITDQDYCWVKSNKPGNTEVYRITHEQIMLTTIMTQVNITCLYN